MISLGLAVWFLAAQSAAPAAVTQDLVAIEDRLRTTWLARDCEGWGSLLAPDWSVIHITGTVITKSQALEMCRSPESPIETMTHDDLSVRVFGDSAVVTGRTTARTRGPNPQTAVLRFSDFCVRRNGQWLIVASHATQVRQVEAKP